MTAAHFSDLQQLIDLAVAPDGSPSRASRNWAKSCCFQWEGGFLGEKGFVNQAQLACQRWRNGRPLKRTEIDDLRGEDKKVPLKTRGRRLRCLKRLGLFRQFLPPSGSEFDWLVFHANHFAELCIMTKFLVHGWRTGSFGWKNAVYLGAEASVGEDPPLKELIAAYRHPRRFPSLADNYSPTSLRWYGPNTEMFFRWWERLPLPSGMKAVPWTPISAADSKDSQDHRLLANTGSTLNDWEGTHTFDRGCTYGVLSCAMFAGRQGLMTKGVLNRNCPGHTMTMLSARLAAPLSDTIANREQANFYFEMERLALLR